MNKKQLRQSLRRQRQQLTPQTLQQAASHLPLLATQVPAYQQAQHIAVYLAQDNEIDTKPLINTIFSHHKNCYVPIIHPQKKGHLLFMPYHLESTLITNRYGILEPQYLSHEVRDPMTLDLVFMPLVAFDSHCHRLGMGGGYYDRSFSHIHQSEQRPCLIGLAFELQKVDNLPKENWDVPLDGIVTEKKLYWPQETSTK